MIPKLNLAAIRENLSKESLEDNRQKSLDRVAQWKKAQADLERHCKEQGIKVPIMVC